MQSASGKSTSDIRQRCTLARERALARQGKSNQALQGQEIDKHLQLDEAASKFLNIAAARLGWSARSTHRALKVARTISDLAGASSTQMGHVAEAMQYRRSVRSAPLKLGVSQLKLTAFYAACRVQSKRRGR